MGSFVEYIMPNDNDEVCLRLNVYITEKVQLFLEDLNHFYMHM